MLLKVIAPKQGKMTELASFEVEERTVIFGSGHGAIADLGVARRVTDALVTVYGSTTPLGAMGFHLQVGEDRLLSCRIVGRGATIDFTYRSGE